MERETSETIGKDLMPEWKRKGILDFFRNERSMAPFSKVKMIVEEGLGREGVEKLRFHLASLEDKDAFVGYSTSSDVDGRI